MRSILLIVLMCWCGASVWAVEDDSKNLKYTPISLSALSADWWTELESLSIENKLDYLSLLEQDIKRELKKTSLDENSENAALIPPLIQQLSVQYSKAESATPGIEETKDALVPPETVEQWLAFYNQTYRSERDAALLTEELARLTLLNNERDKAISRQLVDYRRLAEGSKERAVLAVEILRLQLTALISSERMGHLKKRQSYLEKRYKGQQTLLENAITQLKPDPKKRQIWTQQRSVLLEDIKAGSKSLYPLEQGVGYEPDILPLQVRLEALALSAKLANQTITLALIELKTAFDSALEGGNAASSAPQETVLKQWGVQKGKLSAQFNDLFRAMNESSDQMSDTERSQAWAKLQQARQYMHESELREREVERLLKTYRTISGERNGGWKSGLAQTVSWGRSAVAVVGEVLYYPLFSINESPVTLKDLVWVLLVMVIAILISAHTRKALVRFGESKKSISESSLFTIGRILHYIIIVSAVLIGFTTLGIDLSKLALVAGALSVGIGFGLQSIFNNFISGLILLFERPLKVGDLIELESGVRGRIRSINVRSTQVATWDNIDILVPNSEFISGRVTNYTFSDDLRRLHIPFGVAYGSDKELVRKAVLEAAEKVPHTLTNHDHQADVWLINYGDSSLDFELVVWVKGNTLPKRGNPKAIYLWEIETALAQYGVEIPFPQRDLHVRSVDTAIFSSLNPVDNKKNTQS
ncbi:mechanosensitive ion channel family protein [Alkalimarinus coralli]|uniref:mechanosensitive ion channel family protein n=1 Tax=Alkalimarinus coralli TaxID=2935863 RepID=UPI00202AD77C|nr:mechanosensitive ion channel domain-containing protein [Alkalimarinus coralli]